jgi:Flp pilus assembly secretin CpaC
MAVKHVLAAMAFAFAAAPAALAETPFMVKVDQTVAVKLASPANSVVIGNATVADVTVHDASTLLITGKAYGSTNLVVLDRGGRTIWSTDLAVSGGSDTDLTIVRAGATNTYSCTDKCRGTPAVGDDPTYFGAVMQTVTGKNNAARGQ